MTQIDPNTVAQNEYGVIRLYTIDLPHERIEEYREPQFGADDEKVWPLKDALGARFLDSDFIEVFDVADLADLGLVGYLTVGNGVAERDVEPYKDLLDGVQGHLVMIVSLAFGGFDQTLSPQSPLRFLAAFREDKPDIKFETLPDGGSQGPVEDASPKKRPSDAAMGGRVATIALLVMAALVWVMIKIAG